MKNYITDTRADYAEMFEATKEFSTERIPKGTTVVLVGDKIRPALSGEIPFGAISSTPIMLGNSGGDDLGKSWGGKYMRDEFGHVKREEAEVWVKPVLVREGNQTKRVKQVGLVSDGNIPEGAKIRTMKLPKISPDFDPKKPYVPRIERKEWNAVALLGKVKILKGQPLAPHWIKMKEISDKVDEYLIR